jgi:hypothetical protein
MAGSVMIETQYSYSTIKQFRGVEDLREYLKSNGISSVSFRVSSIYQGTGDAFNEKNVEDISQEDFDWLTEETELGVRTLVVESQLI